MLYCSPQNSYNGDRETVSEYLNVCLVDPSAAWRNSAKNLLDAILKSYGVTAYIDELSTPDKLQRLDMQQAAYDLILADISETEKRAARIRFYGELRKAYPQMRIIFVSSDPLAALDIFDSEPDYFIYKPEMNVRLKQAIKHLFKMANKLNGSELLITSTSTKYIIPTERILYIERYLHDTKIVCEDKEIICHEKLSVLMERLEENRFLRCHCSFLVNAQHVSEFNRTQIVLVNGKSIPCSRANYQNVKCALEQWYKPQSS